MKLKLSLLLAVASVYCLQAQISLTNTYFPANGDQIISANATAATAAEVQSKLIPAGGANRTWDFSFLRPAAGTTDTVRYATATDTNLTKNLAGVDLQAKGRSPQLTGYNVTTSVVELMGVTNGTVPGLNFAFPGIIRFNPPTVDRRAPLAFNGTGTSTSGFSVGLKVSELPKEVRDQLPSTASLADSLRGTFLSTRNDLVDAWGTLKLGATTYNVLRERRSIKAEIKVEAKAFGLWLDVTNLLSGLNVQPVTNSVEYIYWTNTTKSPLAIVATSENGSTVTSVSYLPFAAPSSAAEQFDGTLSIFPNPTADALFVDLTGTKVAIKSVQISDMAGRVLVQQKIQGNTLSNYRLDVSNLAAGNYFLSLNTEGGILTTKSFIVKR